MKKTKEIRIQKNKPKSRSERGQSLVELALTLTILLVLVAGTIDFGRAFFTWVALRDAAQEGALYGSTNPTDSAGIEQRVRDTSYEPVDMTNPSTVAVNITIFGPSCLGSPIQVEVTYNNFPITMPFLGTVLGTQTLTIHATVTDTILRPTCG